MIPSRKISYLLTFLMLICFVLPGTAYAADGNLDSVKDLKENIGESSSGVSDDAIDLKFMYEDENGNALPSVVIKIFNQDNEVVFKGRINKEGICTWNEADPGEYYLKVLKDRDGEKRQNKKYYFRLADKKIEGKSIVTFEAITISIESASKESKDKGDLEDHTNICFANKVSNDVTGNELDKDAELDESYEEDQNQFVEEPEKGKTPSNSISDNNLSNDVYFNASEVSDNKEGQVNDSVFEVQVDLVITSKDVTTGNGVYGAEITVEDIEGNIVVRKQTDKDGMVTIEKLKPGDYEIVQSVAAGGYYKSSECIKISVDEEGRVSGDSNRSFSNTPQGIVVITVMDKQTDGVIEGVGLSISNETGDVLATGQTNANGTFVFAVPDLGEYHVKETSVPRNYTLNASSYTFSVGEGFEIDGMTTIENSSASTGKASSSSVGSYNSPSLSNSGTGSNSGAATTIDVEGVPQTGVADYTVPLVVVSIVLLIIAISAIILEWRRPAPLIKIFGKKGGISHGNNS